MRCVRVVVANRHPPVLRALVDLLSAEKDFQVIAGCCNGTECIRVIRNESPDLALIDIFMPDIFGRDIVAAIATACQITRVVFLAGTTELRELIAASAGLFHGTPPKAVIETHALHPAAAEQRQAFSLLGSDSVQPNRPQLISPGSPADALALLTAREREIMHAVSEGLSNKEVGRRLNVSEGTIKVHLHHIYHKLSITNRASLAVLAVAERQQTRLTA